MTLTANPSFDRTIALPEPLERGAVHRVGSVTSEPGGKGVNVARALTLAGLEAIAVLPAAGNDPLVTALQASAVPFRCVPISEAVRTNLAITETDGTTTKLNERGAALDAREERDRHARLARRLELRAQVLQLFGTPFRRRHIGDVGKRRRDAGRGDA